MRLVDKNYCMSSYLAFRFIEKDNVDFFERTCHRPVVLPDEEQCTLIHNADEIGVAVQSRIEKLAGKRLGVLLSGGMDSAIVASYMPGSDAYTFRFLGGKMQAEELHRAEYYADQYKLNLHYVDIDWGTVTNYLDLLMQHKAEPIHSIEPQIYQAAMQAKADGVDVVLTGDSSDFVFGGMDRLLSRDWTYEDFVERYTFLKPETVLKESVSMNYAYEPYRLPNGRIDYQSFLAKVQVAESYSSYFNAFSAADMPYVDAYSMLKMADKLDLQRIRKGESKYLIRELMKCRYPNFPIPEKVPMPRPVDIYFKNWKGPCRPEFKNSIDMNNFSGDQKWQLYALERFLQLYDPLR